MGYVIALAILVVILKVWGFSLLLKHRPKYNEDDTEHGVDDKKDYE